MKTDELHKLLNQLRSLPTETEWVEFKVNSSKPEEIGQYISSLANSACLHHKSCGYIVFGIEDKGHKLVGTKFRPRQRKIKGEELENWLSRQLDPSSDFKIHEFEYEGNQIVVFEIDAAHNIPVKFQDIAYIRVGSYQKKLENYPNKQRKIWGKNTLDDWSQQICQGLSVQDLDPDAIQLLRQMCFDKSDNKQYLACSPEQFLVDLGLSVDGHLNYACLVLLGKEQSLAQYLSNAEIIFEWRQTPGKIPYDFRKNWRAPFIKVIDDIWEEIDKRNARTPYQEGFFQREIFAFDKRSVREAMLNAVAHRDYAFKGQVVFVYASPDEFLIESPGGFLPGITPENAVHNRAWRNHRLAEILEKTGLIERSGQGLNIIFEQSIRDGKGLPDLTSSDEYHVKLRVPARVKDTGFVLFLQKIADDKQISFSFDEIYELEHIREQQKVSDLRYKKKFLDLGIIERVGRSKGAKYILANLYYKHEGKTGIHTRLEGLSRDTKKELILKHIREKKEGRLEDFIDAFPDLKSKDISNMLQELKRAGKIERQGNFRSGYWILVSSSFN